MELIIGGKAQGKLEYAKDFFSFVEEDFTNKLISGKKVIFALEKIVYDLLADGKNAYNVIVVFVEENDCVFICDEVGAGVVPIDKMDRYYRDEVGKICCYLAKKSSRVHRVHCGIGSIIK